MSDLRIYDVEIDDYRPATQWDISEYQAVARAWGRVYTASKQPDDQVLRSVIEEAFNELMVSIGVDKSPRGPLPDDTPVRGGKIELRERERGGVVEWRDDGL